MMGRQVAQGALFYGFRLDEHVPVDHLLRRIDGVLDFGFVREALASSYSASGRPSIDPELGLNGLSALISASRCAWEQGPWSITPFALKPYEPEAKLLTCSNAIK